MNPNPNLSPESQVLLGEVLNMDPKAAVARLAAESDDTVAGVVAALNPTVAHDLLYRMPNTRRQHVLASLAPELRSQILRNHEYPEKTIGRLMEPPLAVFRPEETVGQVIETLRSLVKKAFVTYLFVTDDAERLVGVVAMRELALAEKQDRLESLMIRNPFALRPEMEVLTAMRDAVMRHFPVYPVCDAEGRLVGLVRGQMLFEAETIELSAQAGKMVGVEKEERLITHWQRSFRFRHPWLQLNLLTAFVAAAVVALFEHTLDRIVLLAVFLPVLAGQSGNTGCQALAVTLRGMTLGELKNGGMGALIRKEATLGVMNGALVGLSAGIGMFVYASMQHHPSALMLSAVVWMAMIGSCVVSGVSGVLVPLTLKKFGADPATASSIFLTTATDVASMGTFLGLATLFV